MIDEVQAVSIALIHIADATAAAVRRVGASRPGLLATRFMMKQDFCKVFSPPRAPFGGAGYPRLSSLHRA
jgi:hypothetical protein